MRNNNTKVHLTIKYGEWRGGTATLEQGKEKPVQIYIGNGIQKNLQS